MSIRALAWAKSIRTGSPTTKAVLVAVADYADEDGVSWPSQQRLADDTELSLHSVMRALDKLEDLGLVKRERRHRKDGSRTSDLIVLDLGNTELHRRNQCSAQQQPMSQAATPILEPSVEPSEGITRTREANDICEAAVLDWNDMARDISLPVVQRITQTRHLKLARRLADCGGLDGWRAALAKIRGSPFCRGETSSWRANFDFLLQESSFTKLMEGVYDAGCGAKKATRSSPATELRDAFDKIDAHLARRREGTGL